MGLGGAGFSLFNIALYSAVAYTSAINVSIEQAGIPVLIFIGNFLLFRLHASLAQITAASWYRWSALRSLPAMATQRGLGPRPQFWATR